jgi:hypothetical protein
MQTRRQFIKDTSTIAGGAGLGLALSPRIFLDSVRSRNKPASDIESMAKTTIVCHLGNIAYQSGRMLTWDAQKQDVASPHDVRHCLSYQREYRKPWKLKIYS